MARGNFFYSTNGTDVVGPVTEDQLRQLWKDYRIGTGSFLCRAGERHWTPLARETSVARVRSMRIVPSEVYASAIKTSVPRVASPVEPVPAKTEPSPLNGAAAPLPAPAPASSVPEQSSAELDEETPPEDGAVAVIVNTIAGLLAFGGVFLTTLLSVPPQARRAESLSYHLEGLAVAMVVIVVIPYFLALLVKGLTRVVIRAVLVVIASLLSIAGNISQTGITALAEAREISDRQKQEAQKEIANKGYYTGDASQAEQNIQKLKGRLADDSLTSHIGRDILEVTTDLLRKVKTSDALEANCNFTLDGVRSEDDFSGRIAAISMLRNAQNDVVIFLQGYDQHCRDALAADHIASATQDDVIAGARKGAHVDQLIALWQEKMKLSSDHVARFVFLQKNWGNWHFTNGEVSFDADVQVAEYDQLVQTIRDDVDKIRETQKQIFQ
jgi:hypothetical protein